VVTPTPGGTFVTKLRGAAQGVLPLIAEIIVAELATRLGLAVPDHALIELDEETPTDDRNDELADLLARSRGWNLGVRYLEGATDYLPGRSRPIERDLASRILWLDGLVMNLDRTTKNPNILVWNHQPWLIDHGAALSFHYQLGKVKEGDPRERNFDVESHLLASARRDLGTVDAACAHALSRDALAHAVDVVPDDFIHAAFADDDPRRIRQAYVAYLWKRLKAPRPFLDP
jgi:hypothetical protein